MAVSDLYPAGCPSGARLTQYPGWPTKEEAHARLEEAMPYFPLVRNTSISWGARIILSELYGWNEPVTNDNWRKLDDMIRERADDRSWHRNIMKRAKVTRASTELARREGGVDDEILQYSLEWAFFTRCQWGEYDTALYELERCWGRKPESPSPIGTGPRPTTERIIKTVEDAHAAIDWCVEQIPPDMVTSTATHLSTDIDYSPVSAEKMADALKRRDSAGPAERDIYASYINEIFLETLEKRLGDSVVFQFSFAAEPLPYETASRVNQKTIAQVAEIIGRHPKLHFQCHVASAHANQSMCTLARELPNFSLAACWWHNFFPSIMQRVLAERLDMLPVNKQVGFFSDAYCIEWTYAKTRMVKKVLERVFAEKIALGQYDEDLAVSIAKSVLFESAQSLLKLKPALEV
jgi:hypothetical protein